MEPTKRSCPSTYLRLRGTSAAERTETSQRQSKQRGTSAAEVTEMSQRPRRPRGRPRRELSTDHDLGSSRSSRDDDVPLPTVGEDVAPQMYDNVIPHVSEEAVPHTSEEGPGGSTSSAALKPYKPGPSQLPKRPIPIDRRPLIAPEGDRRGSRLGMSMGSWDFYVWNTSLAWCATE